MIHRIKRITFFQRTVPILLQNENGPCPLLAVCNGLLLSGKITLPAGRMEITTDSLVQLIANHLFSHPTLHSSDDSIRINAQKNVDDVIRILPAFAVGLDVNCKFNKVGFVLCGFAVGAGEMWVRINPDDNPPAKSRLQIRG